MSRSVLSLYRDTLKVSRGIKDYNFREYFIRRTREVSISFLC